MNCGIVNFKNSGFKTLVCQGAKQTTFFVRVVQKGQSTLVLEGFDFNHNSMDELKSLANGVLNNKNYATIVFGTLNDKKVTIMAVTNDYGADIINNKFNLVIFNNNKPIKVASNALVAMMSPNAENNAEKVVKSWKMSAAQNLAVAN